MADVRLTATNPEDSSVVPVACNEKGELKLEEIPSFDGTLDGDLTVSGSANFASWVTGDIGFIAGENPGTAQAGAKMTVDGTFTAANSSDTLPVYQAFDVGGSSDPTFKVMSDGSATFAETIVTGDSTYATAYSYMSKDGIGVMKDVNTAAIDLQSDGSAEFAGSMTCDYVVADRGDKDADKPLVNATFGYNGKTNAVIKGTGIAIGESLSNVNADWSLISGLKARIESDGSCTFASGKAGFTAEGYLWCTTRRGDTVILDATSNGLASWVEYTPPSRREQIKDAWSEKNAIDTTDVKFPSDPPEKPTDTQ